MGCSVNPDVMTGKRVSPPPIKIFSVAEVIQTLTVRPSSCWMAAMLITTTMNLGT